MIVINFILPAYNEGKNIQLTLNLLSFSNLQALFKIVIVDDNSKIPISLKSLNSKVNQEIKIIRNKNNLGKALSLKKGLDSIKISKNDYIVFLDSDCQYSKDVIKALIITLFKGEKYVAPKRINRNVNIIRRTLSVMLNFIISNILKIKPVDFFVGIKGFNYEAGNTLKNTEISLRYSHYIMIKNNFSHYSFDIIEKERVHGKSSYNILKLIKLAISDVIYTIKIKKNEKFSEKN